MRMKIKATVQKTQSQNRLVCPHCRNTNRFIEVMAEEAHVVNGHRDYIRLLAAVVDHYVCGDCGETIELDEPQNK